MKTKEAIATRDALVDIIRVANVKPSMLQTDQGTEFLEAFDEYLKVNEIKHIINASYSPNQNAHIERANKDIRKIINTTTAIYRNNTYLVL